ncbi:MAG: hypothetical protein MMC33_008116 [Icmadophila ericetorum]|nr:hypothetical protein [Icmadophila ericetorum]
MAPRKEKTEKASADQGSAMILDYLKTKVCLVIIRFKFIAVDTITNAYPTLSRPYSVRSGHKSSQYVSMAKHRLLSQAIDISANLHNKVTKAYTAKALKELQDQNLIAGKTAGEKMPYKADGVYGIDQGSFFSGKQSVYHAIQEAKDNASAEEIAAMDKEIADLREKISTSKGLEKIMKAQLTTLNTTMSIQDLKNGILIAKTTKHALLERLALLRSGNAKPVSAEEKEEADHAWKVWSRHAAVRKKICMDVWDYATEELPEGKTKEELWEERGLEADD